MCVIQRLKLAPVQLDGVERTAQVILNQSNSRRTYSELVPLCVDIPATFSDACDFGSATSVVTSPIAGLLGSVSSRYPNCSQTDFINYITTEIGHLKAQFNFIPSDACYDNFKTAYCHVS